MAAMCQHDRNCHADTLQQTQTGNEAVRMTFSKAANLLRVADMATSRYDGIRLQDVTDEFDCDHRTAQRMMRAFEAVFPQVSVTEDDQRRRRWHLPRSDPRWLQAQGLRDSELAALDMAEKRALRDGALEDAKNIRALRDRLLAAMPASHARRTEADAEALLEAQGFASRPGPRSVTNMELLGTVTEALRAPWELKLSYRGADDPRPRVRVVQPYGVLLGVRQYLVAKPFDGNKVMRRFRLDRIEEVSITGQSFARDPDFHLDSFAALSFGSYHSDEEYGEVIWRFAPEAAETARRFVFHPNQSASDQPDGSVLVRFVASGHLEMAWHLYQWGNQVDVVAPKELRELVEAYRRSDFPSLP